MITVLTPTYNREKLLGKLYDSLKENYKTYQDFEWVLIDDGSIDKTKDLVKKWQKESPFKINYIVQKNQGKMTAINNGMKKVKGDIVIEMDSDDYFLTDTLKMVSDDFKKLNNENIYGIIYLRKIINKDIPKTDNIDNKIIKLFDIHHKYDYDFDMTIAFKSEVRKKYEYKLEHNEKFVTEASLFYKMDQDYDGLLFKNKELICCEYIEDGYSKNIHKLFVNNPYGYYEFFKNSLKYTNNETLFKKRIYMIKHYILFSYLTKKKKIEAIKNVTGINKFLTLLLIIPGYIKSRSFK